jgi:hypothetical protein
MKCPKCGKAPRLTKEDGTAHCKIGVKKIHTDDEDLRVRVCPYCREEFMTSERVWTGANG